MHPCHSFTLPLCTPHRPSPPHPHPSPLPALRALQHLKHHSRGRAWRGTCGCQRPGGSGNKGCIGKRSQQGWRVEMGDGGREGCRKARRGPALRLEAASGPLEPSALWVTRSACSFHPPSFEPTPPGSQRLLDKSEECSKENTETSPNK